METDYWFDCGAYIDGAGSTVSSVSDMLTYLEAYLDPGATPIAESLRLGMIGHRRIKADKALIKVGLGWRWREDKKKGPILQHDGATGGFCSYAGFAPRAKTGVVVLVNSGDRAAISLGAQVLVALAGGK